MKSPKLLVRDSGLLHTQLGIPDATTLDGHPRLEASFEGFAIEQVLGAMRGCIQGAYFWRTHDGAELDLLRVHGRKRWGFEVKHSSAPAFTPSMRIAVVDIKLDHLFVVHPGVERPRMAERVEAVPVTRIGKLAPR